MGFCSYFLRNVVQDTAEPSRKTGRSRSIDNGERVSAQDYNR